MPTTLIEDMTYVYACVYGTTQVFVELNMASMYNINHYDNDNGGGGELKC